MGIKLEVGIRAIINQSIENRINFLFFFKDKMAQNINIIMKIMDRNIEGFNIEVGTGKA